MFWYIMECKLVSLKYLLKCWRVIMCWLNEVVNFEYFVLMKKLYKFNNVYELLKMDIEGINIILWNVDEDFYIYLNLLG